jgi:hypothetical protein
MVNRDINLMISHMIALIVVQKKENIHLCNFVNQEAFLSAGAGFRKDNN